MVIRSGFSYILLILVLISCSTENTRMYDIQVQSLPAEGGTVNPAQTSSEKGSLIQINAKANSDYVFSHWNGDIDSTAANPLSLIVEQDYNLTANFIKLKFPLTINIIGDGTVSQKVIQAKSTEYDHNSVIELRAHPAPGYEFSGWSDDVTTSDNPSVLVIDEPKTVTANFTIKEDMAAFKVIVEWDAILQKESSDAAKDSESTLPITHLGVRLLYPDQNAVFIQSTERKPEENTGIIRLEIPPSNSARMLIAAVHYDGSENRLLKMGVVEDLTIQSGVSYEWGVNGITWTDPHWSPADSLAEQYESGVFTVDKNLKEFSFYFLVRDPYSSEAQPSLDNYLLRLNGRGGNTGYENGYRILRQVVENPDVGNANSEYYDDFYPYLPGDLFQLPTDGARYVVYKKGEFIVNWE